MNYVSLSEIATYKQGKQVPIEKQFMEYRTGMKRFVRIIDFTNQNEPARYIEDLGDDYTVNENSIIMIRYGSQTVGNVVRGIPGIIANNMFQIIIRDTRFTNEFIYYYLQSPEVKKSLMNGQSSSTMPAITFGMLKQIMVPIIEINDQLKIASILDNLNYKVKINNKINNNLSA